LLFAHSFGEGVVDVMKEMELCCRGCRSEVTKWGFLSSVVLEMETPNQLLQCFSSIIIPAVCWTSPSHREFEPCIYTCPYSSTLLCHDSKVVVSAVETVDRQWSCAEDGDGIHHYLGGVRSRRQFRHITSLYGSTFDTNSVMQEHTPTPALTHLG